MEAKSPSPCKACTCPTGLRKKKIPLCPPPTSPLQASFNAKTHLYRYVCTGYNGGRQACRKGCLTRFEIDGILRSGLRLDNATSEQICSSILVPKPQAPEASVPTSYITGRMERSANFIRRRQTQQHHRSLDHPSRRQLWLPEIVVPLP